MGKAEALAALAETINAIERLSFAEQLWYDTEVGFMHEYQGRIDVLALAEGSTGGIGGPH